MISTATATISAVCHPLPGEKPAEEGDERRRCAPPARRGAPPGRRGARSGPRLLGGLHQPHDLGRTVSPSVAVARHPRRAGCSTVPAKTCAAGHRARRGLAGENRARRLRRGRRARAVDGERARPATRARACRAPAGGRQALGGAVRADDRGGGRAQAHQVGGGAARACPHALVEVAADQQEEQQRDGGVEIGVLAAARRLLQAHGRRQRHAERDRHVHVERRARSAARRSGRTAGRHRRPPGARSAPRASGTASTEGVMSPRRRPSTGTDSSMTLPAAKPATPPALQQLRSAGLAGRRGTLGELGGVEAARAAPDERPGSAPGPRSAATDASGRG